MNDALTQFLIDVTRGPLAARFAENRDAVIAESGLDEDLRRAVRDEDVATLWRAGAHPMALLYFSRLCGWSGERYYACVASTDRSPALSALR